MLYLVQNFVNTNTGTIAPESEYGNNPHVRIFDVVTVHSDPKTLPENAPVIDSVVNEDMKNVNYEDPNGPTSKTPARTETAGRIGAVDGRQSVPQKAEFHIVGHAAPQQVRPGIGRRAVVIGRHQREGGRFDVADRLFHDIGRSWKSASSENLQDVRELIPEFFVSGEFLRKLAS